MEQKAEMWLWRKMMRISWTDKLANEVVLEKVGEERQYSRSIKDIWVLECDKKKYKNKLYSYSKIIVK